jgi:putative ATP-dependent endonuclease of OLD family
MEGTLEMILAAADELGAVAAIALIEKTLDSMLLGEADEAELLKQTKAATLAMAKRFGKARFAQVASKHTNTVTQLPKYIRDSVDWLRS